MDIRNIEQHEEDKIIFDLERYYQDEICSAKSLLIKSGKKFHTQSLGGFQLIVIKNINGAVAHTWVNTIQYIEEVAR